VVASQVKADRVLKEKRLPKIRKIQKGLEIGICLTALSVPAML
jgi:hypothetical protein